jgi:hypothetical protein
MHDRNMKMDTRGRFFPVLLGSSLNATSGINSRDHGIGQLPREHEAPFSFLTSGTRPKSMLALTFCW